MYALFSLCVLFVFLYHIYVSNWRQPAVTILGLLGCLFGLLLPFVSYSVFLQIKYDADDDANVGISLLRFQP